MSIISSDPQKTIGPKFLLSVVFNFNYGIFFQPLFIPPHPDASIPGNE